MEYNHIEWTGFNVKDVNFQKLNNKDGIDDYL